MCPNDKTAEILEQIKGSHPDARKVVRKVLSQRVQSMKVGLNSLELRGEVCELYQHMLALLDELDRLSSLEDETTVVRVLSSVG